METPESLHQKQKGNEDWLIVNIRHRQTPSPGCGEVMASATLRSLEGGASGDENWLIATDDVSAVVAPRKIWSNCQGPLRCNQSAEKSGSRHSRRHSPRAGKDKNRQETLVVPAAQRHGGTQRDPESARRGEGYNCAASGQ